MAVQAKELEAEVDGSNPNGRLPGSLLRENSELILQQGLPSVLLRGL